MKFVDYVTITVRSGHGGAGAVTFRRERFEPKGGPNGGDGGKGGSVIIEADPQLYTLLDLRYNRHHFASNGDPGSNNNKTGKDADDIVLRVPCGTVAIDSDTEETLGEVVHPGDRLELAKGGRGGKGNTFFKSATRQAPRFAQSGEAGEERNISLELKLLADVGLVGFPNAGKSTLVSSISAARPKIADYPFTTLRPSLGVVYHGAHESFVIADIPGIIEGAHEGKGLGDRFLRHIERNAVLLIVIPADEENIPATYKTLLNELSLFNEELLRKPRVVAISKMDLIAPDERPEFRTKMEEIDFDAPVVMISAVAQWGLDYLKRTLWPLITEGRAEQIAEA